MPDLTAEALATCRALMTGEPRPVGGIALTPRVHNALLKDPRIEIPAREESPYARYCGIPLGVKEGQGPDALWFEDRREFLHYLSPQTPPITQCPQSPVSDPAVAPSSSSSSSGA